MTGGAELHYLDITEAGAHFRDGSLSPVTLTEALLERIDALDGRLQVFVTLTRDAALEEAQAAERALKSGNDLGPLHGIPLGIKDLYDTKDVLTTSCSRVRESYVPAEDATTVAKLRAAGGIVLGKVANHEFAFGFDSPPARNPWNIEHTPSGSSGGSGSGLGAGFFPAATGSDTGGSIRAPAAANGISGIKPTFGRVSKHGVAVLSWTLDHAGPMARSARDLALMLKVMAGPDLKDPTMLTSIQN
jgi:aspartyl-tRNA(Asn)/glutamyl-tRNA(Gln) amidotransferase subunit A